jgi:hypothetical protein
MEKREKTKGVMRSRNSKYRQYNGKERKDKEVIISVKEPQYIYQNTYNHKSRVTMLSNTEFAE